MRIIRPIFNILCFLILCSCVRINGNDNTPSSLSVTFWQNHCESNEFYFCSALGDYYYGYEKNIELAIKIHEKACQAEITYSCTKLALIYRILGNNYKSQSQYYTNIACRLGDTSSCKFIALSPRDQLSKSQKIAFLSQICFDKNSVAQTNACMLATAEYQKKLENRLSLNPEMIRDAIKISQIACFSSNYYSNRSCHTYESLKRIDLKSYSFETEQQSECNTEDPKACRALAQYQTHKYGDGNPDYTIKIWDNFKEACRLGLLDACEYLLNHNRANSVNRKSETLLIGCKGGYVEACYHRAFDLKPFENKAVRSEAFALWETACDGKQHTKGCDALVSFLKRLPEDETTKHKIKKYWTKKCEAFRHNKRSWPGYGLPYVYSGKNQYFDSNTISCGQYLKKKST